MITNCVYKLRTWDYRKYTKTKIKILKKKFERKKENSPSNFQDMRNNWYLAEFISFEKLGALYEFKVSRERSF